MPQLALTTGPIVSVDSSDEDEESQAAEAQRWARWGAAKSGARVVMTRSQGAGLLLLLLGAIGVTLLEPDAVARGGLTVLLGVVTLVYLASGLHKAWLLARATGGRGYAATDAVIADQVLPPYTVLVPLHREGEMLPVLVNRLSALDYPADKLQILLLIEKDDDATRDALQGVELPPYIQPITVPPGQPKTKPRALNFGLAVATGAYVVVYDAEDAPEPDQLRKAVAAFSKLPPKVMCLQARLGFYNRRQSLLTRLFALDYLLWYTMVLPGLTQRSAFIPLGGTSNHFRIEPLRRLGGWDPFNVTEDADLGTRIARNRLQVAMLDSVTNEEAVTTVRAWTRQRERWLKGYMQTYLVHTRRPVRLLREMGVLGWLDFHSLLGGTIFMLLINPLMWALTLVYIAGHIAGQSTPVDIWIQSLFPPFLYYPSVFCQIIGNFVFLYIIIYASVRYREYDLTPFALLGPLYWLLMSIAGWRALVGLVTRPYHWNKTEHGVSIPLMQPEIAQQRRVVEQWWATTQPSTFARPALSIVLPAYNEERVIAQTVQACLAAIERTCPNAEVVVVDDGSHDRTGAVVDEMAAGDRRVQVVHHTPNRGYGAAVLSGFAAAKGDMLCFMDSDGQFDPMDLEALLQRKLRHPSAAILGYRRRRADPFIRKLNAWGWKQVVRLTLGLRGVRDIDCGFKLLPADAVRAADVTAQGATLNAELLTKLQRMRVPFEQVPVRHLPRRSGQATGANLHVIARAFVELIRLRASMRTWKPSTFVATEVVTETSIDESALAFSDITVQPTISMTAVKRLQRPTRRVDAVEAWAPIAVCAVVLAGSLWMASAASTDPAEGIFWQSLRSLLTGRPLFSSVFSTQPPIFLRSLYPLYLLFGQTLVAARLAITVYALMALIACAAAGRAIGGRWAGVIACALLAINPIFFAGSHALQAEMPALALALIAVAFAAIAMRDVVQGTASLAWQITLALASGVSLGLAMFTNYLVGTALVPVVLYLSTPLWRPKQRAHAAPRWVGVINLASLSVGFATTGAAVLLPLRSQWEALFEQSVVIPWAETRSSFFDPTSTLDTLLHDPQGASLAVLAITATAGLVVALRRRAWACIPLVLWLLASGALLVILGAPSNHELILLVPPISLAAGLAVPLALATHGESRAAAKTQTRRRRALQRAPAGIAILMLGAVLLSAALPDAAVPTSVDPDQMAMARALDDDTFSNELVVTDNPYIAGLADRSVPPELVDTSAARIEAGYLTASQLESIIQSNDVRVVLFAGGGLDSIPGFREWVAEYFVERANFGGARALYVYYGPVSNGSSTLVTSDQTAPVLAGECPKSAISSGHLHVGRARCALR